MFLSCFAVLSDKSDILAQKVFLWSVFSIEIHVGPLSSVWMEDELEELDRRIMGYFSERTEKG